MAIDTEDKRRSALHMPIPVANSDVDAGDRAQVTWNYRGLIAVVESARRRAWRTQSWYKQ